MSLKGAVEASLAGDVKWAFGKLGPNVAEVKADNLVGAAAARWLALSPEERAGALPSTERARSRSWVADLPWFAPDHWLADVSHRA